MQAESSTQGRSPAPTSCVSVSRACGAVPPWPFGASHVHLGNGGVYYVVLGTKGAEYVRYLVSTCHGAP